ncbi:MAG: metallophosphoesterase [Acetobacteraceae bacterium]|nr:metallophosphoesterase [Acetobacteraceae bacterium]MCX7685582.1 metallophosphoesterase [Acetobacteraceae bacterium]MDW8398762.1 metallophosphoesterase [Acetobacteraceae bacterium]
MAVRLVHISDTHLSPVRPLFLDNHRRMAEALAADPPDLIVNTGDISLDGADREADLAFAKAEHDRLPAPCLMIPGNHDVGDYAELGASQPATSARVARWRALVGPDFWMHDLPGWRLIGLDTQILGSGIPEEEEQWAFLARALSGAGARSVALFLHKPLCIERMTDTTIDYWPVLPPARRRILQALAAKPPLLVASGHIHQWRDREADGYRQVWAPPVSFIVGEEAQPSIGTKLVGAAEHLLHADGTFSTRLLTVDGLKLHDVVRMRAAYAPEPEPPPAG